MSIDRQGVWCAYGAMRPSIGRNEERMFAVKVLRSKKKRAFESGGQMADTKKGD